MIIWFTIYCLQSHDDCFSTMATRQAIYNQVLRVMQLQQSKTGIKVLHQQLLWDGRQAVKFFDDHYT